MSSERATPAESSEVQPVCHMLPCSVDYSGRVHGAKHFFQPLPLNEDTEKTEERILATTVRGRGLLGKELSLSSSKDPYAVCVFQVGPGDQGLAVQGSKISKVIEWQHEHVPENLNHAKSRLGTARAWMEVSNAIHEPLPPPEEF